MTAPELIDPFHRALRERLEEQLSNKIEALSNGSAITGAQSASDVAERYAAQTSYIRALRDVLSVCEDLEQDRYGVRPNE